MKLLLPFHLPPFNNICVFFHRFIECVRSTPGFFFHSFPFFWNSRRYVGVTRRSAATDKMCQRCQKKEENRKKNTMDFGRCKVFAYISFSFYYLWMDKLLQYPFIGLESLLFCCPYHWICVISFHVCILCAPILWHTHSLLHVACFSTHTSIRCHHGQVGIYSDGNDWSYPLNTESHNNTGATMKMPMM